MDCRKCGKQYESNAVYCGSCGSELIDRPVPITQLGDRNKGAISAVVFVISSIFSLIILLSSTMMALNMTVSTCDRSMFGICESDFEILGRWGLGFLFVILTVIFFVVLLNRKGKTTKVYVALLIIVMVTVVGTCANNLYQTGDEAENYSQNVEVKRLEDCTTKLKYLQEQLHSEPDNLWMLVDLARAQDECEYFTHQLVVQGIGMEPRFPEFESSHSNYEKVIELYESKQERTDEQKNAYVYALDRLISEPLDSMKFSRELDQKCPPSRPTPVTREEAAEEPRPAAAPVTRDEERIWQQWNEELSSCVDPLVEEFEKKMNLKREKYQSKRDDVSFDE